MTGSPGTLRIVIVDDESLARDLLRMLIEKQPECEIVAECSHGADAISAIVAEKPDLVFLDVQMPDIDGFEVVRRVGPERMPPVLFVTAYDKFAVKAFEVNAVDYLLKPFDEDRFEAAFTRARNHLRQNMMSRLSRRLAGLLADYMEAAPHEHVSRLPIKQSGRVFFLRVEEIDWIEAAGDYVSLHAKAKKYLVHATMDATERKLDPDQFIRIHRSTIVRIDRIKELSPRSNGEYFVHLVDGTELKLTRTYRKNLDRLMAGD